MDETKRCNRCGLDKLFDAFWKYPNGSPRGPCKPCKKEYELSIKDKIAQSKKNYRLNNKDLIQEKLKIWIKNNPKKVALRTKLWRQKNRIKNRAHQKVQYYVNNGTLKFPNKCEWCDNKPVDAHHEDYAKPLDVIFLCKPCHNARHRELKELANVKKD